MPWRPKMKPAVGKSGPGMSFISSSIDVDGSSMSAIAPSMISPRLCGGMLVAMPTAMPVVPLISRFGTLRRQDRRLELLVVVVRLPVDGLFVDVRQHLGGELRHAALRCNAWPRRDRRRWSRSCPGRRRAGSASRSPAPCAPARRRWRRRRAGGTCPCTSPTTRAHLRYGRFQVLLSWCCVKRMRR